MKQKLLLRMECGCGVILTSGFSESELCVLCDPFGKRYFAALPYGTQAVSVIHGFWLNFNIANEM